MPFIGYLRVSTGKQQLSGLGLEAQRNSIEGYARQVGETIDSVFVETESGGKKNRPELLAALAACKRSKATLIIAKLDRLARNVAFVSSLMEAGVEFVAVDAPYANKLMLHILSAFAEHEREMISERTKAALAAAKRRGVVLGANGKVLAARNRQAALSHAKSIQPQIEAAKSSGCKTLVEIAAYLAQNGAQTASGGIVGDLEQQLSGWTKTPDGEGRYRLIAGDHRGSITVIQWKDLVNDAWLRNQATLNAAGLRRSSKLISEMQKKLRQVSGEAATQ